MARTRNERHFDQPREWQWIKHTILGDYLVPWSAKVGSPRNVSKIWVVDAFAGAGSYPDPSGELKDGSPVISLLRAKDYSRPGKEMGVICVEPSTENFAKLEKRVGGFVPAPVLLPGTIQTHAAAILKKIGDAPALILLDPIGLKSLDLATCAPVLNRTGKTDVFVIVHFRIVHGSAGQLLATGEANPEILQSEANARNIDRFFGTADWRKIAVDPAYPTHRSREPAYLELYFDRVLSPRYGHKCAYPVRPRWSGPTKYWLVQASDHRDAFWLMNDAVTKVDSALYLREQERVGQLEGLAGALNRARIAEVEQKLQAAIQNLVTTSNTPLTVEQIKDRLVGDYFGRAREGAYNQAIKRLAKAGTIKREERWAHAKLKPGERITAAQVSAAKP